MSALDPLLPCPFCGGPHADITTHLYTEEQRAEEGWPNTDRFSIQCASCPASTAGDDCSGQETEAEAIACWNRREPPRPN